MRVSAFVLLVGLCGVMAGCGVQPPPAKVSYLLSVAPDGQTSITTRPDGCLRLRSVEVQSPFSGLSLIYRTGEVTFEKDYYNQFLVAPDKQLNDLLTGRLSGDGIALCADGMDASEKRLTLEPHLEALYADFRTPAAPLAFVEMRFVLIRYDRSCRCSSILLDQTFQSSVPLPPDADAKIIVETMSAAVNNVLREFETALPRALE
jgi:hypothetical protein